jgi:hypothetical protein
MGNQGLEGNSILGLGVVAHIYNSSYLGGRDFEVCGLSEASLGKN